MLTETAILNIIDPFSKTENETTIVKCRWCQLDFEENIDYANNHPNELYCNLNCERDAMDYFDDDAKRFYDEQD